MADAQLVHESHGRVQKSSPPLDEYSNNEGYSSVISKRRKVALACVACRNRKVKCDGVKPMCGTCQRRNISPDQCVYVSGVLRGASTKEYIQDLHNHIRHLESIRDDTGITKATDKLQVTSQGPSSIGAKSNRTSVQLQESFRPPAQKNAVDDNSNQLQVCESNQSQNTNPGESCNLSSPPSVNTHPRPASASALSNPNFRSNQLHVAPSHKVAVELPPRYLEQMQPQPEAHSPGINLDSTFSSIGETTFIEPQNQENPISAMGAGSSTREQEHFYGTSSCVSFVEEIRETQQGPDEAEIAWTCASPTHTRPRSIKQLPNLFNEFSGSRLEDFTLPTRALGDHLLDCYWARVHCLYPFVHKPSFMSSYKNLWFPPGSKEVFAQSQKSGLGGQGCAKSTFHCALNAVFALGCQFSNIPLVERNSLSESFFHRLRNLLHVVICDEGSLSTIQTLLIVAQFLQSTQFPNRCWNLVGLACRMAQGLGLYLDSNAPNRSQIEIEMRRRAWHGCVILDMAVSMTLGRPCLAEQNTVPLPIAIDDQFLDDRISSCSQPKDMFSTTTFFIQSIKLYKVVGEILTQLYNPRSMTTEREKPLMENASFDRIMKINYALSDFEVQIPSELRWRQEQNAEKSRVLQIQTNVLRARWFSPDSRPNFWAIMYKPDLTLRYLHTKILLYRSIFSQHCRRSIPTSRIQKLNISPASSNDDNPLYSSFTKQCSTTCIQAAIELVNLIHFSTSSDVSGAWWYNVFYLFTSAMILILAECCPSGLDEAFLMAIENSWQQCESVLKRIGSTDEPAHQCMNILRAMRQQVSSITGTARDPHAMSQSMSDAAQMESPSTDPPALYYSQVLDIDVSQRHEMSVNGEIIIDSGDLMDILWQDAGAFPLWNTEET